MTRINIKVKLSEDVQVNFHQSKEIAYWANKYKLSVQKFELLFKEAGYSISKLLSSGVLASN
ncbi:hypothetical protein BH10BAC2_BH10BAC2_20860 [soil metagenome]